MRADRPESRPPALPPPGRVLLLAALAAVLFSAPAPAVRADEASEAERRAAERAEMEAMYEDALEDVLDWENSLLDAVEDVRKFSVSVVNLRRRGRDPDAELTPAGFGSGVIVTYRGKLWIVTNVHVIAGHQGLSVFTYDGEEHPVELHDQIAEYDIALLKFTERVRGYKGARVDARVSESRNKLREGTWVIATGNPFGLALDGRSVTTLGVVSGLDRFLGGQYQYVGAIQHDTEVNPGNSGGPLWNLDGDLVGINGKIAMGQQMQGAGPSNTGASFSLPVHQVEAFLKLLARDERAQAAWLGIDTETATDERGSPVGARVTGIHRRSPVNGSGGRGDAPQDGDVIYRVILGRSSQKIYTVTDLRRELSVVAAGEKAEVFFKRDGRRMSWKGVCGAKP